MTNLPSQEIRTGMDTFEVDGPAIEIAPGQTQAVETDFRLPNQVVGISLPTGIFIVRRAITKVHGNDVGDITAVDTVPTISAIHQWSEYSSPEEYRLPNPIHLGPKDLQSMQQGLTEVLQAPGRPLLQLRMQNLGPGRHYLQLLIIHLVEAVSRVTQIYLQYRRFFGVASKIIY